MWSLQARCRSMNARYILSLIAVIVLFLVAWAGTAIGLQVIFGIIIPYLALLTFFVGFVYKIIGWSRSAVPFSIPTTGGQLRGPEDDSHLWWCTDRTGQHRHWRRLGDERPEQHGLWAGEDDGVGLWTNSGESAAAAPFPHQNQRTSDPQKQTKQTKQTKKSNYFGNLWVLLD